MFSSVFHISIFCCTVQPPTSAHPFHHLPIGCFQSIFWPQQVPGGSTPECTQHPPQDRLLGNSYTCFIVFALLFTMFTLENANFAKCWKSSQAVAAMREEDLLLLGVLPGHARRILLRLPSLQAVTLPVQGDAAATAAQAGDWALKMSLTRPTALKWCSKLHFVQLCAWALGKYLHLNSICLSLRRSPPNPVENTSFRVRVSSDMSSELCSGIVVSFWTGKETYYFRSCLRLVEFCESLKTPIKEMACFCHISKPKISSYKKKNWACLSNAYEQLFALNTARSLKTILLETCKAKVLLAQYCIILANKLLIQDFLLIQDVQKNLESMVH